MDAGYWKDVAAGKERVHGAHSLEKLIDSLNFWFSSYVLTTTITMEKLYSTLKHL